MHIHSKSCQEFPRKIFLEISLNLKWWSLFIRVLRLSLLKFNFFIFLGEILIFRATILKKTNLNVASSKFEMEMAALHKILTKY